VTGTAALRPPGARPTLFRDAFVGGMWHANYAVMPDGEHSVMFGSGTDAGPEAVVVVNWRAELRATAERGASAR
jgi:hypothetical protein